MLVIEHSGRVRNLVDETALGSGEGTRYARETRRVGGEGVGLLIYGTFSGKTQGFARQPGCSGETMSSAPKGWHSYGLDGGWARTGTHSFATRRSAARGGRRKIHAVPVFPRQATVLTPAHRHGRSQISLALADPDKMVAGDPVRTTIASLRTDSLCSLPVHVPKPYH